MTVKSSTKRLAALVLCAVLCINLLTGCSGSKDIKFGSAGIGGTYHAFATCFASLLKTDDQNLNIEVKSTAGTMENLRLLSKGELQLAIAQADLTDAAYNGSGSEKLTGYSAIASLYDEACQIVVRADSSISTVADLSGKTVSIGEEGSGTEQNALQILEAYNLAEGAYTKASYDYITAAQKLQAGEIDAFFCTIGAPNTFVEELSQDVDVRLLPVDGAAADALIAAHPFYTKVNIPAGTYGIAEAVDTIGVRALLLASDSTDKAVVQMVTETLFEHVLDLNLSLPISFSLDEESANTGITIPFHPGATSYYNMADKDHK